MPQPYHVPLIAATSPASALQPIDAPSGPAFLSAADIADLAADPTAQRLTWAARRLPPDRPEVVTFIAQLAGTLPPIERDAVIQTLHITTGIRLSTLRAVATDGGEPDHLALARKTLASIGTDNVLHADQRFWFWTGGVWTARDDQAVKQQVQAVLEAERLSVQSSRVNGVTDVLRNDIYRPDHRFNVGPADVVNCLSGELELSNGIWLCQPHRREHFRTTQIPVEWNADAALPQQFLQFLHDIFRDDADKDAKIWAVLELFGYTLMAHAKHERFVMLIGNGANGKSVLLSVLKALCGVKNVAAVQLSQFDNRFQRAHLYMKLANIVTELKEGALIADAELKAITSGELTTVENKGLHPFEMEAFATCWFGTNHLPHTRDFSEALFRRATILTFNRTFATNEQDHNLATKLVTELPAILKLALDCYARATMHGFHEPQSSVAAKEKWKLEADQVAQFVQQCCVADPLGEVLIGDLYQRFRNWATNAGIRQIVTLRKMGDRLEVKGFYRKRSDGSKITGLKFRYP